MFGMNGGLLILPLRPRFESEKLLFLLFGFFVGISYAWGFFKAGGHCEEVGKSWDLMRLIVADAGSLSADLREFFLRRLGRSGRLLLLAVLKTTPFETKALSYNFVARETTGKLFLDDKHFSLSMNKELDLIFRSCSSFALFIRRSWWELSASFN